MDTQLLIIGAGPFGLSLAAEASRRGMPHAVVGRPMSFWREHMPPGMLLRSACDWHLDPASIDTIEAFLATRGESAADVEPLSLAFYLDYAEWFRQRKGINPVAATVTRLDRRPDGFAATCGDGQVITAANVVLAPGFRHFPNVPPALTAVLPPGRFDHTCDRVDLAALRGKRCVIVGGRQSAFEWAALLREADAAYVHVVYRHDTPRFETSDWSWVTPLVERLPDDPGWFRRLSDGERDAINRRFWEAGRMRLEPWLAPRVIRDGVTLHPRATLEVSSLRPDGALRVVLDTGTAIDADHVILATGYKVDLAHLPYLAAGNMLADLELDDGFPVLDEHMQTSVRGLYVTSMPATKAFGAFFAFTVSVRAAAKIVCRGIAGETAAPCRGDSLA
jgi:cation diffusion facilitator CzcD-associated flavoprotein CzcO